MRNRPYDLPDEFATLVLLGNDLVGLEVVEEGPDAGGPLFGAGLESLGREDIDGLVGSDAGDRDRRPPVG